jgi:predicted MPP superfamily phosphohydrolase
LRRFPTRANKLLIIPDAHAHPDYDNTRFDLLGALIADEKPDVIVCLGDFADLPSLSSYDKGTKGFEGRRYRADLDATHDALGRLRLEKSKARHVMLLGNHEARIDRTVSKHAELEGTMSTRDLGYAVHGWDVVPYEDTAVVCGFAMSHHFASGVGGRPISGSGVAAQMSRMLMTSAVIGHNHVLDLAERTRPDGTKVISLSAGCFVHPKAREGWNRSTAHMYWRGVIIMDDAVSGGYGALRCITQKRMARVYG